MQAFPTVSTVDPWQTSAADVVDRLDTSAERGLDDSDVVARRRRFGTNEVEAARPVPVWTRLARQFAEPFSILLVVATLISLAAWVLESADELPLDAIVIAVVLVANATLGMWQERRAEQAVAALKDLTTTHVTVMRGGETVVVGSIELVPGDIVVLSEGDAIGADGRLIETASLQVAEAALTGESQPVEKQVEPVGDVGVADRTNMVFSGTAVASGHGRAVVTATGMQAEVGQIARLLQESPDRATPLQRELVWVGKAIGGGVVAVSVLVVAAIFVFGNVTTVSEGVEALLVGVSLAVAAVPEGLPAILSVVLALGVQRMADNNALVKRLSSVETLGSASVICTDKTGTLTRNEMTVTAVVTASGSVSISGVGYDPTGRATVQQSDGRPPAKVMKDARLLLMAANLSSNATVQRAADTGWEVIGDPTEGALVVAEDKLGASGLRKRRYERIAEVPFTSDRKLMSTVQRARMDDSLLLVTKGAPDILLDRCTHERVDGHDRPLTAAGVTRWLTAVDQLADDALRTIGVACRSMAVQSTAVDETVERDLVFLGLAGMIDPPREEAKQTIAEAERAGIRMIAITGDHPRTALRIGQQLGLASGDAQVVTGQVLQSLDDDELRDIVSTQQVFARVAPADKLRIVRALQANGDIVAMTGDGVNDAPALRHAEIGVAMGVSGTEVSKEAADMILTDDDLATLLDGIREGRRIFDNISKFLRYLLPSNTAEVLVMLFGIIAAGLVGMVEADGTLAIPLLATQILWINLMTDTGLALALGVDTPVDDVMLRPPRKLGVRIIDRQMLTVILFTGLVMSAAALAAFDWATPGGLVEGAGTLTSGRTQLFTVLVFASILVAFNSRSGTLSAFSSLSPNRLLWLAAVVAIVLQVAVVQIEALGQAFDTVPMTLWEWGRCAALSSTVLWSEELRKFLRRRR